MRSVTAGLLVLSLGACRAVAAEPSPADPVEASSPPRGSPSHPPALAPGLDNLPVPPTLSQAFLASVPPGQITPAAEELLDRAIELDGCPGVRIVEWRPLEGREATTGPSSDAVGLLASTCRIALAAFDGFVAREAPLPALLPPAWRADVSLLPSGREGPIARTFADQEGRFASREKTYNRDGILDRINGYTHYPSSSILAPHDVLLPDGSPNERALMIFAHELFHAMSWESGLFTMHPVPRGAADEILARRFTAELGMGE